MLGRLLKTQSHLVKKEQAEWRARNPVRREQRYGPMQSRLMALARRPLLWSLTVLSSFAALSIAVYAIPCGWFFVPCGALPRINPTFEATDVVTYFSSLWTVQATVAALIYPIVIALVVLLLQRGHSAKAILHIYLHDSAAIFSGLSAIFLLVLMLLQYLALPAMSFQISIGWVLADGVWFLFNLGLTAFFVHRTFSFVQPSRRAETIRKYAIDVVWPCEFHDYLASHLFANAVPNGLLPGPDHGTHEDEDLASIVLGPELAGTGTPVVARILPKHSRISEIRYRLLGWAANLWERRVNIIVAGQPRPTKTDSFGLQNEAPRLIFPLDPNSQYSGDTVLCATIGKVGLSRLERFLVQWAFSFSKSKPSLPLTVGDVLDDIKADALDAFQSGASQPFTDTVDELVDIYCWLIEASAIEQEDGEFDNYTLLLDRRYFFGRRIYIGWSQRFVEMFQASARQIGFNDSYYRDLIYVPLRLFLNLRDVAHSDLLKHIIELHPVLFLHLMSWWTRTVEQQGVLEHNACNPAFLRPPYSGTYESILREFVGEWEHLKNAPFMGSKELFSDWPIRRKNATYLEVHLHATARMLIRSTHRGDLVGADRVLDVLMRWFSDFSFQSDAHSYLIRRQEMVSFELTQGSWEEIEQTFQVEQDQYGTVRAPRALFAIALRNYRCDVCCIVAYLLARLGKDCQYEQSLPAHILREMFFKGEEGSDEQSAKPERPVSNANDLISAILRQYHAQGGYLRGYRNRLDKFVQSLVEITRGPMVPGRTYSRWGADDLGSLRDGQLILLALFAPDEWHPLQKVERTIREWVGEGDETLVEIHKDFQGWMERLESPDFAGYRSLYECVRGKDAGPSFDEAIARVRGGIDEIVGKIDEIREEAIRSQPVSPARLEEMGRWTSARAFSKETGAFPISRFKHVVETESVLNPRPYLLGGSAKGEYTDPPMAPRSSDEEEFFGSLFRDRVAALVLDEIIKELAPEKVDGGTPETYWEQMKRYSDNSVRAGKHPILLIENGSTPDWIPDWTYPAPEDPQAVPSDLKAWRDTQRLSDAYDCYLGNFNDVEVYSAPIPPGASILMTAETLKALKFTKLPNGTNVLVEDVPVEGKPAAIDLRLTWWFELELDQYPAVTLDYTRRGK